MKHDKKLLKTVHGSHEGIDKQVYTSSVIPLEDMKKNRPSIYGGGNVTKLFSYILARILC
jgi:hypothetical protein